MQLKEKLRQYVEEFNQNDPDGIANAISNAQAYDFLAQQIPLVELPDADIERAYYFRWWTYRKHLKKTPAGWVITEFLPDVPWAGAYNTINCPAGFHIREGRWLRDPESMLEQYMDFWFTQRGSALSYSTWLAAAVAEYCEIKGDWTFAIEHLDAMKALFQKRVSQAKTQSGLFYSIDDRDGMEYSISGSGARPTLNSYLYADARAIARIAAKAGDAQTRTEYDAFAQKLKERMMKLLWTDDFFKTLPEPYCHQALNARPDIPAELDARELVGYIPWYFGMAERSMDHAFDDLLCERGFAAPAGLTTAERRHPRYMEAHDHECLWNGPVWPFATSQVLVALANMLHREHDTAVTRADYVRLLRQYACAHRRTLEDGREIDWIDENMDPETGAWLSRCILEAGGWKHETGGYERGRDYNHSLFCDLVLSGLLGIRAGKGKLCVEPLIPDEWTHFRVENLYVGGRVYSITYDPTTGMTIQTP